MSTHQKRIAFSRDFSAKKENLVIARICISYCSAADTERMLRTESPVICEVLPNPPQLTVSFRPDNPMPLYVATVWEHDYQELSPGN